MLYQHFLLMFFVFFFADVAGWLPIALRNIPVVIGDLPVVPENFTEF
jgi:hypothetical protein